MAISLYTVTGNATDLIGVDYGTRKIKVVVTTNLPTGVAPIDLEHNTVLLGGAIIWPNPDGSFEIPDLIGYASDDVNPAGIQYKFDLKYVDKTTSKEATWTSGWVSITADADIKDLIAEQYVPPTWLSDAVTELQGYVDQGQDLVDQGQVILDAQIDLSGIAVPDALVEGLVKNTGGAGPLTSGAVIEAIDARVPTSLVTTASKAVLDARIEPIPNIVFEGDSLSSSGISTSMSLVTYNNTMPAFAVVGIDPRATLYNVSAFGDTVLNMVATGAAQIDTKFVTGARNVCVLWGGTNDLGLGAATAAQVLTRTAQFVAARRAAGWRVVTVTMLPRTDGAKPVGFDANRATINTALIANAGGIYGDAIANPASDTRIGDDGDSEDTTYYSDKLHMTPTGYAIVAQYVRKGLTACGVKTSATPGQNPAAASPNSAPASLAIGEGTIAARTTGANLTALGHQALKAVTTGNDNTAVGTSSQASTNTGSDNTSVGWYSMLSNTTGSQNTAIGVFTLLNTLTAGRNTAVGHEALKATTGAANVAVGAGSAIANTSGTGNVALGNDALAASTTTSNNTAVGAGAMQSGVGGVNAVAVGALALRNGTGAGNVALGYSALYQAAGNAAFATTSGTRNVGVGQECGQASATQRNDTVAIGYRALVDANDTVALGSGAQALHATGVALGKGVVTTAAAQVAIGARHLEYVEVTAPGVATTNGARVYAKDNGSGKTQLCVIFQTGTEFVLATEA